MSNYNLGLVETKFADLIWQNEPIASGDLVKLCNRELGWKKSTTYTVLRKVCEKGIFQNNNSIVTSLLSQEAYMERQCQSFLDEKFDGSLPAFVNAFTKNKKLTPEEVEELGRIIEAHSGE